MSNFDLTNAPDDVYLNVSSDTVNAGVTLASSLAGLAASSSKRTSSASCGKRPAFGGKRRTAYNACIAREQSAPNIAAAAAAASQERIAASQERVAALNAKSAAIKNSSDKMLGMSKPLFYGVVGVLAIGLVIGGVVIFKRVNK